MTALADGEERLRVLTALDETLLVEAAAGTGKTALMASRVTMLLLNGVAPESIAAITFTELAASELVARIHRYVDDLLEGRIPKPLQPALGGGLSESQRAALQQASGSLGLLTTATIHAFCQKLITSYAVEADIDPGAGILDADRADAAFDAVFERWLKRRLGGAVNADDAIAVLSRDDPRNVVSTLKDLADFRRRHRDGRPAPSNLSARMDIELATAVSEFREWTEQQHPNSKAGELLADLKALAAHFEGRAQPHADFATLWQLAHPPQLVSMASRNKELRFPTLRNQWVKAAGKAGAEALENEARERFERVSGCYAALLGSVSTSIVERLSGELDEVLADYDDYKRRVAVFDFDDLLRKARALVNNHETVRLAIGARYQRIFVDEFQDTDPIQCEILFLIAAKKRASRWQDCRLREGGLFLVGDPKQAIYGFRGADIECYSEAREAIKQAWPANVVQITANFRSRPDILTHVNSCFSVPLNAEGQPGYVALTATLENEDLGVPSVTAITVDAPPGSKSADIRNAEAEQVAHACARLVGSVYVQEEGTRRLLRPGDIALLAPTGTELWRYEQALERKGLPVASQAGKSLFRRQETQDLLALARTLADPADGVAFGALLRGPLVGLTDEELLDIAAALPTANAHGQPSRAHLTVLTRVGDIAHPLARDVVATLQDLRRRARVSTPALVLAEAVERLHVRPILVAREGAGSARALANVEAFIERARLYAVTGLKRFARDMTREWRLRESRSEGRVDGDGDAIEILTIHSAKGLEWPVVIPINTATWLRGRPTFVHRLSDNTIHWIVGDVVPPGLRNALAADEEGQARERQRLWYVACTRSRELLIVPRISVADSKSWARVVEVVPDNLVELDLAGLEPAPAAAVADLTNEQERSAFARDQERIAAGAASLTWLRPSTQDADRLPDIEVLEAAPAGPDQAGPIGAGRVRGLILHKLMEEVLTGELVDELGAFTNRAALLLQQLDPAIDKGSTPPSPGEMAETALRTLAIPAITDMRPRLLPELPVFSVLEEPPTTALTGRIDASEVGDDGRVATVLDWKSDVNPTDEDVRVHAAQLMDYLRAVDARRGALVYMTAGAVRWILRDCPDAPDQSPVESPLAT